MIEARTDVVGSLLRPPELLEARAAHDRGELAADELVRVEDAAVDDAIRLQEDAGLDVVTDGEMRRLSFQSQLPAAVEGFGEWDLDAFLWGEWRSDELDDMDVERPPLAVESKLRRKRFLSADEFAYARERTDRVLKVTLPSPSLFANFWDPERSTAAYPTPEEFLGDVAEILREEVDELVRLGADLRPARRAALPAAPRSRLPRFYESRGLAGRSLARARRSSSTTSSSASTTGSRSGSTSAAGTRRAAGSSRAATTGSPSGCSRGSTRSGSCSSTTTERSGSFEPSPRSRRARSPSSGW